MSIKKRLDLIVKELGMSGRAFEKECGLANGSYSSIRDGVGADKLNKILFRFPQISADWLICGNGEMLKMHGRIPARGHVPAGERSDSEISGSVFANEGEIPGRDMLVGEALNPEDIKTILFQMAGIVSSQQQGITRLVAELEQNGKRTDRLMDLIENGISRE